MVDTESKTPIIQHVRNGIAVIDAALLVVAKPVAAALLAVSTLLLAGAAEETAVGTVVATAVGTVEVGGRRGATGWTLTLASAICINHTSICKIGKGENVDNELKENAINIMLSYQ